MATTLIRGRIDDVRVPRIEGNIADACVFANREDEFPVLSSIKGLVEAAISALGPQWSLGGYINHIGIPRINQYLAYVF